mmetsp:Transcript_18992/g.21755  ORF Transcript_18992/g.21755 Transcript_18992/m.21755 type:complete len:397 (+) Transcript_18992:48-1238(+)|eukprot:CAMPEP_0176451434 /NCGR_PEP_ID=MMETSP0127-20121128/27836_1 /TAXON_ID=938130 /ORGANISM="Platyophrya macrostoma, Strain WH" /LENGTH=396 /DNA_ID=CAMNT_0017839493 /DNA_START=47 /DNA_END=1237 /DNA_ORIENTATION=-
MSGEGKAETPQVTPWDVEGDVDYDKLIRDFGCHPIDEGLIQRMESLTGKRAHHFLRRGIFFSHRDLHLLLDLYEKGQPFYLYTGRGPSSESMHTGHLVPFMFTKWLQDTFQVPLVIQITEDEKFYFKDLTIEEVEKLAFENIKDIIAMGFNRDTTFIFRDFEYVGTMYRTIARIEKAMTASQVRGCFGFKMEDNVGKWMFPAIQAAPSFSVCFPHIFNPKKQVFCLIPQAIDQDPYFRMTRDIAPRLGFLKPALIHSKFFPGLSGSKGKMSSSVGAAVFLTDSEKQIKDKINKHAFSGGGATKEEHLSLGGNTEVDVPIQWLSFFLEDDDTLNTIKKDYALGRIMTGDVKKTLITILWSMVKTHQEARKKVTDEDVKFFTSVRPIQALPNAAAPGS